MMAKLHVIKGTAAPDTPAEKVRAKMRARKHPALPSCHRCGGIETITARMGKASNKLCVVCLMGGQRVIIE
ncbi:hypothetical protein GCM10011408_28220 [Dyella caseinilytica]|nr:hypothetical protein GCM10011408_28220 [Dyella caseinilytica]